VVVASQSQHVDASHILFEKIGFDDANASFFAEEAKQALAVVAH
jgi:hypothetical protein